MAEFKDATMWMRVCLLLMPLSHLLHLFSYASGTVGGTGVYAVQVIAFLCIIVALLLILCIVFLDELQGNKIAKIFFIIFSLIGGLCLVIAVAMVGTAKCFASQALAYGGFSCSNPYSNMLGAVGGVLAIICGIFAILDLVGCKTAKITVSVS